MPVRFKIPPSVQSLTSAKFFHWQGSRNLGGTFFTQAASIFLSSLVVAGVISGIRQAKGLQSLELAVYDQMVRSMPSLPPDPRLVVVGISEADIQKQKQWPLSDKIIAQLLDKLQQHQPKVIGLDIHRDVSHPPGYSDLNKELQADNVIVIAKGDSSDSSYVPPPAGVPKERVGFSDLLVDPDNIVRRSLLYVESPDGKERFYSFALLVSLKYLAPQGQPVQIRGRSLQLGITPFKKLNQNSGSYQLEPSGAIGWQILRKYHTLEQARQITLTDLLQNKVDPSAIKDKVVLIGYTAPSVKDLFVTPYSISKEDNHLMPGVVLHAQTVSQILSTVVDGQRQFWFMPEWGEWAWIWGWSLLGGLIVWRLNRPLHLVLISVGTLGGIWGIGWLAFTQVGWIPVMPPMIGLIVTSAIILGHKTYYGLYHDLLTHLPNRRYFLRQLKQLQSLDRLPRQSFVGVMFLDLDRFKTVNEGLGHQAGDYLLIDVAHRLQSILNQGEQLARVGGDEFAIWLSSVEDIWQVTQLAQTLQKELMRPFNWHGQEIYTSISIGIVLQQTGNHFHSEELLRESHIAMYRAKDKGRARYEIFVSGMKTQAEARWQIETDLRKALQQQEFRLYYQPIISLKTGKIAGFEALVRWQSDKRGFVSPGQFIPVAEETGLIVPMGNWILQEACRQMQAWHQQFPCNPPLMMSVNLSSRQFNQPDLIPQIQSILEKINIQRSSLKLEITESMMMSNIEETIGLLKQLKALGLRLSIDDFGTGYSNLSYLHRFPIDTLKIDQSFVQRMHEDEDSEKYIQMVRTVLMLGHNLNLDVIAEGIETEEQMKTLRSLRCEYGQGYFFAKPLPSEEATILLNDEPQW